MQINGAQAHLLLNHWPVLTPFLSAVVVASGLVFNRRETRNVGLALLLFGALAAIPTYFTGGPAQNVVQNYPLITVASIEKHRSLALYALCALEITGFFAAILLWQDYREEAVSPGMSWGLVALTLATSAIMAQTAHLGGLIRHEELTQLGATSRPKLIHLYVSNPGRTWSRGVAALLEIN